MLQNERDKVAAEVASAIYYGLMESNNTTEPTDFTRPISQTMIDIVLKKKFGYPQSYEVKQLPNFSRMKMAQIREGMVELGYISVFSTPDALVPLYTLNVDKIRAIPAEDEKHA